MLPEGVIYQCDPHCAQLFGYCDLIEGDNGRPARNYVAIAAVLGWQPRTVETHAKHLAECGLLRIEQEGQSAAVLRVVHQPSRKPPRVNPECTLVPVDRRSPPRAGSRAGHRERRGENRRPPVGRLAREAEEGLSRVQRASGARVERGSDARSTRVEGDTPLRVERGTGQVSRGLEGLARESRDNGEESSEHGAAIGLLERGLAATVTEEVVLCRADGCGSPARDDQEGYCEACAPF
jgi:hypothetical protein